MQPCKRIACHGRYDDTPLEFGVPYMCTNPLVAPRPFWRIDQNHLSNLGMLSQVSAGSMWAVLGEAVPNFHAFVKQDRTTTL